MIRLLVSDLDGTLFNAERRVAPRDRDALLAAAQAGVALCLASGRMHEELTQVMEEIGHPCHRISQNGAYVYTCGGRQLHEATFEPELARELYLAAEPYGFVGLICVGQTIYIPRMTEDAARIQARMYAPFTVRETIIDEIGEKLVPCKLSFFGDMARLVEMQREIEQRYAGRVDAMVSDKDCVDLMPLGVSKGAGLQVLLKELGIPPEETLCIGDSCNDLSMLRLTPHSFAMSHGHPELKAAASHVVGCVADAVEWALRHNRAAAPRTT